MLVVISLVVVSTPIDVVVAVLLLVTGLRVVVVVVDVGL